MQIDLSGKSAVVTGSTAGIGYAIARALSQAGARVLLNGRTDQAVKTAIDRLRGESPGADVSGVASDLATAKGCTALAQAQCSTDILVNNVGVFVLRDFLEAPDDLWENAFAVNVMSGVRLSRLYLPGMMQRGWGRILFISSESAINIPADMIHYGLTKTADLALSRGLAKRAAGTGVTVNAILPGPTLSDGLRTMLADQQKASGLPVEQVATEFVKANRSSSILKRVATVEEVANLVAYVASPLSSATTGAALRVDGGVIENIT
jgi:NAD(P)-dependent dehydrogenase (short-subunit alcohol dehydrogenase family)